MWWWLTAAIVCEVCGTLALRSSDGFTRSGPIAIVVIAYSLSFYALSQALVRGIALGSAYAIWSAVGIAAIAVLGIWIFDDSMSGQQLIGLGIIVVGIVVLQLGASHA
jgi:small multidrug resistance pump